ncbi:aldehyde dehydrogenase family protein [Deferribacter autotrophicus]|uniref:Aldehyde dehydrogenase family protein n=1 Tax=Deferribacter autotrophicus TaxID=500465 RepID=A0A5A8F0G3_9BACT|nr:aldehyde dehydrogenase family protein [Deferribacter autotrophicus]KAA0256852.1 aldehyde dehydrogenase family protein [Deferribacter autotrophicus]
METKKLFFGGKWRETEKVLDVTNPYNGEVIARVYEASKKEVEFAINTAYAAREKVASLTAKERGEILEKIAMLLQDRAEDFAKTISLESGKAIKFARGEVARAIETFKFSADVARSDNGEVVALDAAASGKNRFGYYKRHPIGVVGAITPFNFPLNLVAHKVGPGIAAGCPVVLKPASSTPITAIKLVEVILEAGFPAEGINIVVGSGSTVGNALVESDKVAKITFTGSPEVGLQIKAKSGTKRVTLELGNNGPVIVHKDADIAKALPTCVVGGFANSGQVCISVQRIYIHESIYDEFKDMYVKSLEGMGVGDQLKDDVVVGPMIDLKEAERVEQWVNEAVSQGAKILVGGKRKGSIYYPTVLENCTSDMKVVKDEVFAPVVSLFKYNNLDEAIRLVNDTKYGLQVGVFTQDINTAFYLINRLDFGGVIVNDVPTFRVDNMPYGGVKLSGLGREGVKYAVDEMTEVRMVVFNLS